MAIQVEVEPCCYGIPNASPVAALRKWNLEGEKNQFMYSKQLQLQLSRVICLSNVAVMVDML